MDLENLTPFAARLLVLERAQADARAIVVVKATYALGPELRPDAEQLPVIADRLETAFGLFHTDHFVHKAGVDFVVLGTAQRARAVTELHLRAELGTHVDELVVFGARTWQPAGALRRDLAASAPEPFAELPLAYGHAFGGSSEFNYEPVVWPDNPQGTGFYLTREQAAGRPLPRIEPAQGPRVAAWDDRPTVAGWGPYPMFWGLRAREGVEVDEASMSVRRIRPRLNNNAHPAMIAPAAAPGDRVALTGLRDAPLVFTLPRTLARVRARAGADEHIALGAIDGVIVWADEARVTVTHRVHFGYAVHPEELRHAVLDMVAAPA